MKTIPYEGGSALVCILEDIGYTKEKARVACHHLDMGIFRQHTGYLHAVVTFKEIPMFTFNRIVTNRRQQVIYELSGSHI